ncbi:MAG: protein translocase subunit SecD [Candidatus Omnitrophica bacterium]|nr:protein translocase subunit SecD [Candidatus Omnitrophota bacterium]
MDKFFKWKVILAVAIIGFCLWKIYPPDKKINLGLDLQGGIQLVLRIDLSEVPMSARKDATDRALEIIRNRIDQFGVKEPSIHKQGADQIVIQLPGVTDRKRALSIVGKTALLEFKLLAHDKDLIEKALAGTVPEGYEVRTLKEENKEETVVLEKKAILTGNSLVNAGVTFDQGSFGQPVVNLEFDKDGAAIFARVTGDAAAAYRADSIPRRLAIVLDDEVRSAPMIKERIPNGKAIIQGNFTYEEASDIAMVLRAGALPAPVRVEEERVVGPTLGSDSIRQGIIATVIGAIGVFGFMAVYYFVGGMIANFALFLNFIILLGVMAAFGTSLTLPGIAGIVLTLGMAVDANVLIFERMREELKLGKAVRSVISAGYHKAFSAIFDSNITTILAASLLFWFGVGPVRGFAVTLTIGIAASMFTAIVVTRLVYDYFTRGKREIKIRMLQLIGATNIDFIKIRFWAYLLSVIVIAAGMFFFFKRGPANYGVDFSGGMLEQVSFTKPINLGDIRKSLSDKGLKDVQIQDFGSKHDVLIKTTADVSDTIESVLNELAGKDSYKVERVEMIGPAVGSDLSRKAIWALLFSLAAIFVYVSWRFRFSFAFTAIIALLHDVLITVGALAITGRQFSLSILAAILTIVGYSVNDTIVIYDRIREDMKLMRKSTLTEVINASINQTLSRTILTTSVTLLAVLALFLFGGEVINDFAFAMLVGCVSGVYSTVFVASPLLVDLKVQR